eukprot:284818100_5
MAGMCEASSEVYCGCEGCFSSIKGTRHTYFHVRRGGNRIGQLTEPSRQFPLRVNKESLRYNTPVLYIYTGRTCIVTNRQYVKNHRSPPRAWLSALCASFHTTSTSKLDINFFPEIFFRGTMRRFALDTRQGFGAWFLPYCFGEQHEDVRGPWKEIKNTPVGYRRVCRVRGTGRKFASRWERCITKDWQLLSPMRLLHVVHLRKSTCPLDLLRNVLICIRNFRLCPAELHENDRRVYTAQRRNARLMYIGEYLGEICVAEAAYVVCEPNSSRDPLRLSSPKRKTTADSCRTSYHQPRGYATCQTKAVFLPSWILKLTCPEFVYEADLCSWLPPRPPSLSTTQQRKVPRGKMKMRQVNFSHLL